MAKEVKRRTYDSSRRRAQARLTREAIVDGARALFVERGYVGATLEAIAAEADVAVETIYAIFKNKRSLLAAVVDTTIVGDHDEVPVLERPWVAEMRAATDPVVRCTILARNATQILARLAPIADVLRAAGASDTDCAAIWQRYQDQRLIGQQQLVKIIASGGHLRKGLTADAAADIVFAVGSPETFRVLVAERGWSEARFEKWYGETLARLLL